MSRFDGRRLPSEAFGLDVERLRRGWYSDKYFVNIQRILSALAARHATYTGSDPDPLPPGVNPAQLAIGDVEVEMQWFCRRKPFALIAGVDEALAILKEGAGRYDAEGKWHRTAADLRVWAVHDGDTVEYGGDPERVSPVLRVRGRYRDFAILETPTIGALTRGSRVATNTYEVIAAAGGKPVLFFPARFDIAATQPQDGYAYYIANRRYAAEHPGAAAAPIVSTDAQGAWWGGTGSGTVAHAAIACFLGDGAAAMLAMAEIVEPDVPRIALVDFRNDCVSDTLKTMDALWPRWLDAIASGDPERARRYVLYGVRPDTSYSLRDVSVEPTGDPRQDNGVNPRLIRVMRDAIDKAWERWNVPERWKDAAQQWCRSVRIVATGGFTPERIRAFEAEGAPVDAYGVGSSCLRNDAASNTDFTADVVRVKIGDTWVEIHKAGRAPGDNPDLEEVTLA